MDKLLLYGTECCHLCEEARALLYSCGIEAEFVDIAANDFLLEKYGARIPVLQLVDSGEELGWPFAVPQLGKFLG